MFWTDYTEYYTIEINKGGGSFSYDTQLKIYCCCCCCRRPVEMNERGDCEM